MILTSQQNLNKYMITSCLEKMVMHIFTYNSRTIKYNLITFQSKSHSSVAMYRYCSSLKNSVNQKCFRMRENDIIPSRLSVEFGLKHY